MRCILWTLTWQQKLLLLLRLWSVLWEHYHDIIMSRASFKNVRLEFLLGVYFKFPKIISYRFTPFGDIKPNLIIRNNKNTVHWIDWIMNSCIHCIKFSDSEFFFVSKDLWCIIFIQSPERVTEIRVVDTLVQFKSNRWITLSHEQTRTLRVISLST